MVKTSIFFLLLFYIFIGSSSARSSGNIVIQGNKAFEKGLYDEALRLYEKAMVDEPESPHLYFNQGNAHYMKGDYKSAIELFEKSALKTNNLSLEAQSYFNMGNASFRQSERLRDGDLKESVEELKMAVGSYQKAVTINPELKEAAHNIEVARLLMKQIMDEIKKQQEKEKKEAEKRQQAEKKLKEIIKKQEKLITETKAQRDKDLQGQDLQGQDLPSDKEDTVRKLAKEQDKIKKETKELADNISPPKNHSQKSGDDVGKHLNDAMTHQDNAINNLNAKQIEDAIEEEKEAKDNLAKALEEMSSQDKNKSEKDDKNKEHDKEKSDQQGESKENKDEENKKQQQQKPGGNEEKQDKEKKETKQAVGKDEDAKDLLDKERKNRERRNLQTPYGSHAVDKDW